MTAAVTWCDASSETEIGEGKGDRIYGNQAALPCSVVSLSVFVFIFQDQSSEDARRLLLLLFST